MMSLSPFRQFLFAWRKACDEFVSHWIWLRWTHTAVIGFLFWWDAVCVCRECSFQHDCWLFPPSYISLYYWFANALILPAYLSHIIERHSTTIWLNSRTAIISFTMRIRFDQFEHDICSDCVVVGNGLSRLLSQRICSESRKLIICHYREL